MKQALRVARKQSPPDLVRLPIAVAVAPDPADAKPALPAEPGPAAPPAEAPAAVDPAPPQVQKRVPEAREVAP